jgi:ribosomal protein S18 acetylase RimI-like enzyme
MLLKFTTEIQKHVDDVLYGGLDTHREKTVQQDILTHNVVLYDGDKIAGGLKGHIIGDAFYIELLCVDEAVRGRNHGRAILQRVEQEAVARDIIVSYVDTASYQAPGFYEKCGYSVIATIPGYYQTHDRIFLKKNLI